MRAALTLWLSVPILAVLSRAQIEPGWGVFGSARNPAQHTKPGIWTFDPLRGGFRQILGLPASCTPVGDGGVYSTLVRDSDGVVVAGTVSWYGSPVEIHVSSPTGSWTTYTLGTAPAAAGAPVSDLKWLPGGRVVFSYYALHSPNYGLSQSGLAVLDLSLPPNDPAAIRPIAATGLPSCPSALAVDPNGKVLYVGYNVMSGTSTICSVPLGGGVATVWTTVAAGVFDLFFDLQGRLMACCFGAGLLAYDTSTWTAVTCKSQPYCGGAIDRTTGAMVIGWLDLQTMAGHLDYGACGAVPTPIPGFPSMQLAGLGLDVRASLIEFDRPPMRSPFTWQLSPNPGGAPRVGNAQFSLSLTASPVPQGALLVLGAGRQPAATVPPFANHVLVDPRCWFAVLAVPAAAVMTVPLPLSPNLMPFDLYAQVFDVRAGMGQGSSGVRVHVF